MSYKSISHIGSGGFGVVDKVSNDAREIFARKTFQLNQGPNFPADLIENVKKRFKREANIQSALKHKNIVPVIEKDVDIEPPYFIMPLAENSLEHDIAIDRTLGGNYLNAIMDIIAGLEEIHPMSIYHRDLKPANVLRFIDQIDGKPFYAITDFGLMSISQTNISAITQTGMRMGSDYYTAPEIVKDIRRATAQSDIYSLGCILHDMVGTDERIPCNEIKETSDFGGILLNCTRNDPQRRFKSVSSLREALLSLGDITVQATTSKGAEIFDILSRPVAEILEKDWELIVNFIDDEYDSADSISVLRKLSIIQIEFILDNFAPIGKRLGLLYATYIRDNSFIFSDCDGLSIRLEKFILKSSVDVKAECLMSLLFLGTSHNRWYVERKFESLVGSKLQLEVAKRLAVEIRADSKDACKAINHLKISINYNLSSMHEFLRTTVLDICK